MNLKYQYQNYYSFLIQKSIGIGGKIARKLLPLFAAKLNIYNRNKKSHKYALEIFLYNAWLAYKLQKHYPGLDVCCGYSRDRSKYKAIARYFPLESYKAMIAIIDIAETMGYTHSYKGFKNEEKSYNRISMYRPTEKLINFFKDNTDIEFIFYPIDPIRLKNENKDLIDYIDDDHTIYMRKNIKKINDVIVRNNIQINIQNTHTTSSCRTLENNACFSAAYGQNLESLSNPENFKFWRVFNEDFCSGGRFYAKFQSLPKDTRQLITIASEKTISLDYTAMHVNMLYNLDERGLTEDPYASSDPVQRARYKNAVMVYINCDTETQTVKALCPQGYDKTETMSYIERFKKENDVDKYSWRVLQYKDSRIAELIMLHFAEQGEVCLGVHDGFIVRESLEDELRSVMIDSYEKIMGWKPYRISREY